MGLRIYQAGQTGPAANIGGSSAYHIDSKFSTSLGEAEARRLFEEKVRRYNELGRDVEFSNQGVGGRIYDLSADEDTRSALFRQAYSAHAPREGWYSLDYYAPNKGRGRYHKSAEGAPIFAVGYEGGKRETGVGGNYGFHSMVYNKDGQLIAKVGHGDDRFTDFTGNGMQIGGDPSTPKPDADKQAPPVLTPEQVNTKYDKLRMAGDVFKAEEFGMAQHKRLFNKT